MNYTIISKNPQTSSIVIQVGGSKGRKVDIRVPRIVFDTREVDVKTTVPGVLEGEPDQEVTETVTETFERGVTADDVRALLQRTADEVTENLIASPVSLESIFSEL
jgi:hypothetical protein